MKTINKNNMRTAWVAITNGTFMLLLLTAPLRDFHMKEQLFRSFGSAPPPFSYWRELLATPLTLGVSFVLVLGILAELRRNVLALILNVVLYAWCLAAVLIERAKVSGNAPAQDLFIGLVFVIVPLSVVLIVDSIFYARALLRKNPMASPLPE